MPIDYHAGSRLLSRVLDHAVADEGFTFTEALEVHYDALPGVLHAAVDMRREEQKRDRV